MSLPERGRAIKLNQMSKRDKVRCVMCGKRIPKRRRGDTCSKRCGKRKLNQVNHHLKRKRGKWYRLWKRSLVQGLKGGAKPCPSESTLNVE